MRYPGIVDFVVPCSYCYWYELYEIQISWKL